MKNSRGVSRSKRPIIPNSLAARMSEIISLREQVAQAELSAGVARLAKRSLPQKSTPIAIRK
jgi:hypothetical protein